MSCRAPAESERFWEAGIALTLSKGGAILLLLYWSAFALVVPVTVWDSHTYNLARLPIAASGGLFANPLWTTERQIIFPWTFDALHYPALLIRAGYALPSFACLAGVCWIVFTMVRHFAGRTAGWLSILLLLAMPTVVFQASSTKNDLGLVFASACAVYGFWRYRLDSSRLWIALAAAAIGFLPGIKTSGVPLLFAFGACGVFLLRKKPRHLLLFLTLSTGAVLLFGSVEIYLNNWHQYGNPLGAPGFVRDHSNRHGFRGAAANAIRYVFGLVNPGLYPGMQDAPYIGWLEQTCRGVLQRLHLQNVGYRPDFNDETMRFLKMGWESSSDYGAVGTICVFASFWSLLRFQVRTPEWIAAACGWLTFGLVCWTTGWMPWNNRFLLLPVVFFSASTVLVVTRRPGLAAFVVPALVILAAAETVIEPLASFNKRPADLLLSVARRSEEMFRERGSMQPVLEAVERWQAANPSATVYLCAGSDSWVLPFFLSPKLRIVLCPRERLARDPAPGGSAALLLLNRPDISAGDVPAAFRRIQSFDESATSLWEATGSGSTRLAPDVEGVYSDGWTEPLVRISTHQRPVRLTLWNPTPIERQITVSVDGATTEARLAAGETIDRNVAPGSATVVIRITPPWVPSQAHQSADTRALGLRLAVEPR